MGDWFQTVVDCDANESESRKLGDAIHQWLIGEGIVSSQATDCVLGIDTGYRPGAFYQKATGEPDDDFLQLTTNGLDIISKRNVFHSGQGGFKLVCSACSARFDAPEPWDDAVGQWYQKKGLGLLSCPNCSACLPVNEWTHDPPWGFGNLGFEFWNWPPLATEFVTELGNRLEHRVILVSGKL